MVYVGQPLDTIKVKMQTFPTVYKNMIKCFQVTLKNDGIYRGLYAGTVPALATNIVENSVLFLCYGFCQKFMQNLTQVDDIKHLSTLSNATAGFLASFFSSVAICPTELVKCKLQALSEMNKLEAVNTGLINRKIQQIGPMKLTAQIIREEGSLGLFRGLVPTLVREMPGYFFFFGGYEGELIKISTICDDKSTFFSFLGMREFFCEPNQSKEDIGLLKTMIAGAVGGSVFWTLTYPVDVAKSRIQVKNTDKNLVQTISEIVRKEGFRTLYKGLSPTLLRTVPATATLFATYEYSKKWLTYLTEDY